MQARERTPRFIALDVSIDAIQSLRPVVAAIRRFDRDLEDQLRRALTSISLNLAEGNRSQGRHRIARFFYRGCCRARRSAEMRAARPFARASARVPAQATSSGMALLFLAAAARLDACSSASRSL